MADEKKEQIVEEKKVEAKPEEAPAPVKETKAQTEIVKVIQSTEIANSDKFEKLTRGQLELIKRTVAVGASDDELRMFIQVCAGARLNPFLRQAHLVPFWDSKNGCERRAIIIGIDGFRAIAESGGQYAGNDDPLFAGEETIEVEVWEGSGKARKMTGKQKMTVPGSATSTVYKVIGGQRYPFGASARWKEYYPGPKKGIRWHAMPYLMLGKCAEGLALRKAFPKLLSGLYVQEEMDQALNAGAEEIKITAGFKQLLKIVEKADQEALIELAERMRNSDKYSKEQKAEFEKVVAARMKKVGEERE